MKWKIIDDQKNDKVTIIDSAGRRRFEGTHKIALSHFAFVMSSRDRLLKFTTTVDELQRAALRGEMMSEEVMFEEVAKTLKSDEFDYDFEVKK